MSLQDMAKWTAEQVVKQTKTTYSQYKKIAGFEDVGFLLKAYVIEGGVTKANIEANNVVDVFNIVVSLDDDIMAREGASFKTEIANTIYYVDFTKDGNWHFGTAHTAGVVEVDYLTIAEISTDSNSMVDVITDARGRVGGFLLKDEFGLEEYAKKVDLEEYAKTTDLEDLATKTELGTVGNALTNHVENLGIHVTQEEKDEFAAKAEKSDIKDAVKYYTTTGTDTAFEVEILSITTLEGGIPIHVKLHVDAGTNPTITVNEGTAVDLFESTGKRFRGKAGFYTFVHDGTSFISVSGKGGGEASINVYTLANEPDVDKFEGVKIGTSENIDKVVITSDFVSAGTVETVTMSNFPVSLNTTNHRWSSIYFKGLPYIIGYSASSVSVFYRYNKDIDTWTNLASPSFGNATKYVMFEFENELYAFSSADIAGQVKKYDVELNSWSVAFTLFQYAISDLHCIVGRRLYFIPFSATSSTSTQSFYYYDFDTNTRTTLANIPFTPIKGIMYVKGNDIKIRYAERSSATYYATYNMTTNTWTSGAESAGSKVIDSSFDVIKIGSKQICLESGTTYKNVCVYDTTSESVESNTLTDISNAAVLFIMQANDDDIRLISTNNAIGKLKFWLEDSEEFEPNTVVITRQSDIWGKYATELVSVEGLQGRNTTMFDDVLFCDNDGVLQKQLSLSYGNGTSWITLR